MEDNKKRKWNKYSGVLKKKKKTWSLETGMMGFLCTCNFREKECIRDAYKILETYANDLPDEKSRNQQILNSSSESLCNDRQSSDEDISDALNKELKELGNQVTKPIGEKKFQYIDTGVKNVIFIRTTMPKPWELAIKIIYDLYETKRSQSRFLLRLIPIQITCKANINDIKSKSSELFEEYFAQEPKTFSIVFNRHCNNTIKRSDVIEILAKLISEKNPGNRADLKNPEIAIVVEVVKAYCLISIAPDYFKYKKYNLQEICHHDDDDVKRGSDDEVTVTKLAGKPEIKDHKNHGEITTAGKAQEEDDYHQHHV